MERLLYQSKASPGTASKDVFEIIEASSRNNRARGVTGFLLHDGDRFLQLLEGPPLEVEGLVAHIERDQRHHDLEVLSRSQAEERWFPDWSMKHLISFGSVPALEQLRMTLNDSGSGRELLSEVEGFLARG